MLTNIVENAAVMGWNGIRKLVLQALRQDTFSEGDIVIGHRIDEHGHAVKTKRNEVRLGRAVHRRVQWILGGSGGGKTTLILTLIESDIAANRTVFVIDLQGDLIERVLLRLAANYTPESLGNRLLLIDLLDDRLLTCINPLASENAHNDYHTRAAFVLSVFHRQFEGWGPLIEEVSRFSLLALAETGKGTLLDIEPLLTNARFREAVLKQVTNANTRDFFQRYNQLKPDIQRKWSNPVINKLTPITTLPTSRRFLSARTPSFSFRTIFNDVPGAIVLIGLASDRLLDASTLLGGLIVATVQHDLMSRVNIPEHERVPVRLYLDEFQNMANEHFGRLLAEGRRFSAAACVSHQATSQLDASLLSVLRNNSATSFFLQTGAVEADNIMRELTFPDHAAIPWDRLRERILLQEVGQAFLARRGEPTIQVQIKPNPDPDIDRAAVEAIRQASFKHYARTREEIDEQLSRRDRYLTDLRAGKRTSEQTGAAAQTPTTSNGIPAKPQQPGGASAPKPNESVDVSVVEVRDGASRPARAPRKPRGNKDAT